MRAPPGAQVGLRIDPVRRPAVLLCACGLARWHWPRPLQRVRWSACWWPPVMSWPSWMCLVAAYLAIAFQDAAAARFCARATRRWGRRWACPRAQPACPRARELTW